MYVVVRRALFTRTRNLAQIVDAVGLGVRLRRRGRRRPAVVTRMPGRWNSSKRPDKYYCCTLGAGHFSAVIEVLRDRGAGGIKVIRQADDRSGVRVPERPLQRKVLSVANPTIAGWLLIAKALDAVPPGRAPGR